MIFMKHFKRDFDLIHRLKTAYKKEKLSKNGGSTLYLDIYV